MAGHRALRHRTRRRFRVSGASLQIPLGNRPRNHRRALEWLGLLRPEKPPRRGMTRTSRSNRDGGHENPVADRGPGSSGRAERPLIRKLRCAVYTRKSTEEGLEMEFNSLDAQREACEAYVASQ